MPPKRRARGEGSLSFRESKQLWIASVPIPGEYDDKGRQKRKQQTSKDFDTAVQLLKQLQRDADEGLLSVTNSETVATWLEHWLDNVISRDVKPTTLGAYRAAVNNRIVPHIGRKKLKDLTPAHVRGMRNGILAAGQSTGSALDAYRVLSKALTDAKREGVIRDNPCERVAPPQVTRTSRGSHDVEQVKKLFAHLAETDDPLISRWTMALFTGARQAECLGLEWDRVNFVDKTIDISWTLQWLKLKDRYRRQPADVYEKTMFDVDPGFEFRPIWKTACLIPPKTVRSRRVIPMLPELEAALLYHRDRTTSEGLVWTREGGKPLRKADDAAAWHKVLEAAEIPDLTLHSARHTVATLLQAGGVPEATRMALMGHSTAAMARHYAHVDQTLARQGLEQYAKMLETKPAD